MPTLPSTQSFSSGLIPYTFQTKILHSFLISIMCSNFFLDKTVVIILAYYYYYYYYYCCCCCCCCCCCVLSRVCRVACL